MKKEQLEALFAEITHVPDEVTNVLFSDVVEPVPELGSPRDITEPGALLERLMQKTVTKHQAMTYIARRVAKNPSLPQWFSVAKDETHALVATCHICGQQFHDTGRRELRARPLSTSVKKTVHAHGEEHLQEVLAGKFNKESP